MIDPIPDEIEPTLHQIEPNNRILWKFVKIPNYSLSGRHLCDYLLSVIMLIVILHVSHYQKLQMIEPWQSFSLFLVMDVIQDGRHN